MEKGRGDSKGATSAAKGIVIREKYPQDEMLEISPSKKGKQAADTKKKGSMPPLEDKKKGPTAKALAKSKATSSRVTTKAIPIFAAPGGDLG